MNTFARPGLNSGYRKLSPEIRKWQAFAMRHDNAALTLGRVDCVRLVKQVGRHMGLSPSSIQVFEFICMITRDRDWTGPGRPLCTAKIERIAHEKTLSYRSVQRALRQLVQMGFIVERLRPNSHRATIYARNGDEQPCQVFGVDPSITALRADELRELAKALDEEAIERRATRRSTSSAVYAVRELLEIALDELRSEDYEPFQKRFMAIPIASTNLETARQSLADLIVLQADLLEALDHRVAVDESDMRPSYGLSKASKSSLESEICREAYDSVSLTLQTPKDSRTVTRGKDGGSEISTSALSATCPAFSQAMADLLQPYGPRPNMLAVRHVVEVLRAQMGISPSLWQDVVDKTAQEPQSGATAITLLATTFELHSHGHVANPGGFLRGLHRKNMMGQLMLSALLARCATLSKRPGQ